MSRIPTHTTGELFWMKVNKTESCWLWTASKNGQGRGVFWDGDKLVQAHRYAYTSVIGAIPDGLCVLHKCDVQHCVNPDHLFIGTIADNNRDMINKDRQNNWGWKDRHLRKNSA